MKIKKHIIYKYCHRPFPFKIMGIKKAKNYTSRVFKFLESCRYSLDNGDQFDWNKLFGFSFGLFGIHANSVRFVWRYNPEIDKIDIAAYWYKDNERNYYQMCSLDLNNKYTFKMEIDYNDSYVRFCVLEDGYIKLNEFNLYIDPKILNKKKYQCGVYFGGNRRAPHKIELREYSE